MERYVHCEGSFSGKSAHIKYIEVDGFKITAVCFNGERHHLRTDLTLDDVRSFVDMGWWVEYEGEP